MRVVGGQVTEGWERFDIAHWLTPDQRPLAFGLGPALKLADRAQTEDRRVGSGRRAVAADQALGQLAKPGRESGLSHQPLRDGLDRRLRLGAHAATVRRQF